MKETYKKEKLMNMKLDAAYNIIDGYSITCFVRKNHGEYELLKVNSGWLGRYVGLEFGLPVSPLCCFEKLILNYIKYDNHPTNYQDYLLSGGDVIRYYLTEDQLRYIEETGKD